VALVELNLAVMRRRCGEESIDPASVGIEIEVVILCSRLSSVNAARTRKHPIETRFIDKFIQRGQTPFGSVFNFRAQTTALTIRHARAANR
jgi:hypothetical protein